MEKPPKETNNFLPILIFWGCVAGAFYLLQVLEDGSPGAGKEVMKWIVTAGGMLILLAILSIFIGRDLAETIVRIVFFALIIGAVLIVKNCSSTMSSTPDQGEYYRR